MRVIKQTIITGCRGSLVARALLGRKVNLGIGTRENKFPTQEMEKVAAFLNLLGCDPLSVRAFDGVLKTRRPAGNL